jgi:putative FmdB family regulatory protein
MPIYAYRCDSCGAGKDVLQKVSDAPLTVCPECGAESFRKELTAPAFQLKGSGWYVTDFRNNGSKPGGKAAEGGADKAGSGPAPGAEASPAGGSSQPAAAGSTSPASPAATTPSA